jgi:hypothetical protein
MQRRTLIRRLAASARSKPSALGDFIVLRSGAFSEFCFKPKHRFVGSHKLEIHRVCQFGAPRGTPQTVTWHKQMASTEAPLGDIRRADFQSTYHEQVSVLKPHEGREQKESYAGIKRPLVCSCSNISLNSSKP